ncbi:MAG: hypothetical protein KF814_06295 [Nitrospiraceae bacterium]|nr:hypothetical protein [Nitrospiraceae bacterium]
MMMHAANRRTGLVFVMTFCSLIGCAGPEPVLKSNQQLLLQGKDQAEREVDLCRYKAEQAGLRHGTNRSSNAAAGAVIGLLGGAGVGASSGIVGGPGGVAIGAAAGGVVGGVLGFFAGAYKPVDPQPDYTQFIERCLKERGYETVGWQ